MASLSALDGESNVCSLYTAALTIGLLRGNQLTQDGGAHRLQHFVRIEYNDHPIAIPGCRP